MNLILEPFSRVSRAVLRVKALALVELRHQEVPVLAQRHLEVPNLSLHHLEGIALVNQLLKYQLEIW